MYIALFAIGAVLALHIMLRRSERRHAIRQLRPVLEALSAGRAGSFQVVQALRVTAPRMLDRGESVVIVWLRSLELLKLVEAEWIEGEKRRKRVYTLTERGGRALATQG